jgi:hypothetical protein
MSPEQFCMEVQSGPMHFADYAIAAAVLVPFAVGSTRLCDGALAVILRAWRAMRGQPPQTPLAVSIVQGRLFIDATHPWALRAVKILRRTGKLPMGHVGTDGRVGAREAQQLWVAFFRGDATRDRSNLS